MLKKIGLIAVFIIAACVSFFIIKTVKDNYNTMSSVANTDVTDVTINKSVENKSEEVTEEVTEESTQEDVVETDLQTELVVPTQESAKKIVLKASKPVEDDNKYSFNASFIGEPTESYHFELWSNNKLIKKSENGSFVDIPAIKGGKYKLCMIGNETRKSIASPIVVRGFVDVNNPEPEPDSEINPEPVDRRKKLITEEEFQKRMLTQGDHTLDGGKSKGNKSFVTKGFRVVVVNAPASDDEFDVSDIQDLRDMIYTYKSARVVELEYDASGYVTLAKVEPVL